jgi:hypothetical protein
MKSVRNFLICSMVLTIPSVVTAQVATQVATHAVPLAAQQEQGTYDSIAGRGQAENSRSLATTGTKAIRDLADRFVLFQELREHEVYSITIAADIPDNNRPGKVYYKKEPGHVFIILEQKDTISNEGIAQVWGFYPVRPVSSVFLRTVRCQLNDNGKRKYDVRISRRLSAEEFEGIKKHAIELAKKKYNLNKYNCYDYAVELFNSIPGIEKLPVTHVKFPFIFGRGGSPCGLYKDLQKLKTTNSGWAPSIEFGSFKAPASLRPLM